MSKRNELKEQIEVLEAKKRELLFEWKMTYELDSEHYETPDDIEDAIYGGEILPEWNDLRDIEYLDRMISSKKLLARAFEIYEKGDHKSIHDANKAFETLVTDVNRIKEEKKEDIKKAQDVVDVMDEILKICNEYNRVNQN